MAKTLPEYSVRFTGSKLRPNLQRTQTDLEQTSYAENKQFRFFDEWHDEATTPEVPINSIIVYKFETVNALNITSRVIELWEGARTYQVYGLSGVTFAGTLVEQSKVFTVNNVLNEYIETHPVSGVTVSRYIGTESFTSTNPAVNGTAVRTSNANNQQTITYNQSGEKAGVAAGSAFYLVFKHIPANNDATQGMFRLTWEELTED
jgi:hypothetical protein